MPFKIKLYKTKNVSLPEKEDLKMLVEFLRYASEFLKLNEEFSIRLVGKCPNEPMTLGCYDPQSRKISTIIEGRHFLDFCRTIAHEMVHQRQQTQGRLTNEIQEIGGDIEDEANFVAGRIVKSYIKNKLTKEQKKKLGLGTY